MGVLALQVHNSMLSVTRLEMVMMVVVVARVVVICWEVRTTGLTSNTSCRVLSRVRCWFPRKHIQRMVVVEAEGCGKCDVHLLAVRVGLH